MSSSTSQTPSRPLSIFMGTLAAFASFALIAALLQAVAGGRAEDPTRADRLQKKADVAKEQGALMEKYGLSGDATGVFAKVEPQIKARKVSATTQVVPGSPTALKQASQPPAPAPAAPASTGALPAPNPPAAAAPGAAPVAPATKP